MPIRQSPGNRKDSSGRFLYSLGSSGLVAYRGCGEGDMDADGDVDSDDYALWSPCMAGPDITTTPGNCDPDQFECADVDYDGDVDLRDFATLQRSFGQGP